jgi:hypothetical protein
LTALTFFLTTSRLKFVPSQNNAVYDGRIICKTAISFGLERYTSLSNNIAQIETKYETTTVVAERICKHPQQHKSIANTSFVGSHVEQASMVSHHALPCSLD